MRFYFLLNKMEKINLNFFGEEVTIDTPKDLSALRAKISKKYSLSGSDVSEIILYYVTPSPETQWASSFLPSR